ncbi:MAG TPA: lycopene cyclase domain-containing protein [Aggregatilineales bacterium]|nr:lycopene cyclase domain-containing protein [Aggregatilineales bacterium]
MGQFTYLFLILIWAGPLIVLQWLIGGDILLRRWKVLLGGIVIPTLYLTCVDGFAIRSTIWTITPLHSTGIFFPGIGVPLEEGVFFLVTNTLIVQSLILIRIPQVRQRITRLIRLLRLGPRGIPQELTASANPRSKT